MQAVFRALDLARTRASSGSVTLSRGALLAEIGDARGCYPTPESLICAAGGSIPSDPDATKNGR